MGPNPRYVEELRIGGGYGSPLDGGVDLQNDGTIRTNGSLTVDGQASLHTVAVSLDATVGGNDGQDHSLSIMARSDHRATLSLRQAEDESGGTLYFDGGSGTIRMGSRNGSASSVDAMAVAKGQPDAEFFGDVTVHGNVTGVDGLRLDGGAGTYVLDTTRLGAELILNGDVEGAYVGGLAPNWSKSTSGTTVSAETAGPYSGLKSQRVVAQAGKYVGSAAFAVAAGKCYVLSCAIKVISGTGLFVRLFQTGAIDRRVRTNFPVSDWSIFTDVFRCPSSASSATLQFWNGGTSDVEWLFDSVSLREASEGDLLIAGKVGTSPSSSSRAGLSIPQGSAPSTPIDGDVWMTPGGLHVRTNGVTLGPLIDASLVPWSAPGPIGSVAPSAAAFSTLAVTGNITTSGDVAVNGGDVTSSGALAVSAGGKLSLAAGGVDQDIQICPSGNGRLTVLPSGTAWPVIGGYNPALSSNYSGTTFFGILGNANGIPTEYAQMTFGIHDNAAGAEKGYVVFRVMDKPNCGGLRDNAFLVTSTGIVSHGIVETGGGIVRGSWNFPLQLVAQGTNSDVVLAPGGSGRVVSSAEIVGRSMSAGTDGVTAGNATVHGGASTDGGKVRIRKGNTATGPAEYSIGPNAAGTLLVSDGADDILGVDGAANRVGVMTTTPGETLDVAGQARVGRNASILLTNDGGFAVKLVAGETLAKGDVVALSSSTAGRVAKTAADYDEPAGIVYSDLAGNTTGIASGSSAWIVVHGIAKVNIDTAVSLNSWLRTSLSGGTAGRAATGTKDATTHWKEVGHALEAGAAGGQVLALLSFD